MPGQASLKGPTVRNVLRKRSQRGHNTFRRWAMGSMWATIVLDGHTDTRVLYTRAHTKNTVLMTIDYRLTMLSHYVMNTHTHTRIRSHCMSLARKRKQRDKTRVGTWGRGRRGWQWRWVMSASSALLLLTLIGSTLIPYTYILSTCTTDSIYNTRLSDTDWKINYLTPYFPPPHPGLALAKLSVNNVGQSHQGHHHICLSHQWARKQLLDSWAGSITWGHSHPGWGMI